MKKIGVVLSGCGVYDGSEIHEAVLVLLSLARQGGEAICYAPDKPQFDVINHLTGELMPEKRNILVESARIARGTIHPLSQANRDKLDALIVPGGLGTAKNLSTLEKKGGACQIDAILKTLVNDLHAAGKPLGFICIAPTLLPKIFNFPIRLTIGTDRKTAELIESMGSKHIPCSPDGIVVDEDNKIVTTPAYMLAESIARAAVGIDKLVERVLLLTEKNHV